MSDLVITKEMTKNEDIVLSYGGFPFLYVGRGSYSSDMGVRSQAVMTSGTNEVHLIYIGRYVSIGDNIQMLCNLNHDYRSVYQGVIDDYADDTEEKDYRKKVGQTHGFLLEKGMIVIGNDVWIGNNVTIISDVRIGNGAVIGAGSVITKDVPPYTIWAGNPARQIGTRFDVETIRKFQDISWWEFSKEKLLAIKDDMQGDPYDFVRKYWKSDMGKSKEQNRVVKYLAFLDIATDYSTFGRIVEEFLRQFSGGGGKLTICYDETSEDEKELADSLRDTLGSVFAKQIVDIRGLKEGDDEAIIALSDHFILGRDIKNILRISYAFKHGTTIISGVNEPMIWS